LILDKIRALQIEKVKVEEKERITNKEISTSVYIYQGIQKSRLGFRIDVC
jgi:hypothetical protein